MSVTEEYPANHQIFTPEDFRNPEVSPEEIKQHIEDHPVPIVTVEDIERQKAAAADQSESPAVPFRQRLSRNIGNLMKGYGTAEHPGVVIEDEPEVEEQKPAASQKLGQLLAEVMTENGLTKELEQLDTQPNLESRGAKIDLPQEAKKEDDPIAKLFDQDAKVAHTKEPDTPVESSVETATTTLRQRAVRGLKRARSIAGKGNDAIKSSVIRAQTALGLNGKVASTERDAQAERGTKLKTALKIGAFTSALAVAGYATYKGFEMFSGSGESTSNMGEAVGEAVGKIGAADQAAEATQAANEAVDAAEAARQSVEYVVNAGDMPWNVLENAGIPAEEIISRLDSAAQKLQAAEGIPYEWHGSGTRQWLEVNNQSDTQAVIDLLKPYL